MANSLATKLLKAASKSANVSLLSKSKFKDKHTIFTTPIVANNVILSGNCDGGAHAGLTIFLGESRTFKSGICLANVKAFLDAKPNSVCLFFDCEFGSGDLIKSYGIPEDRIIHIPFTNIEQLKIVCMQMMEEIAPEEDVIIFVDSVSQVASKKEVDDALAGEEKTDLTRAKSLNSFFRMVTPILTIKNIPMFVINSFYADISNKYAEVIMKGGGQAKLSADSIVFVTRSQVKKDKDLMGWDFNYSIMKSRFVKEKSKFTITIKYDGGIDVNSNMFDWALESGMIFSEKQASYQINLSGWDREKTWKRVALESDPKFFEELKQNEVFKKYVHDKYALEAGQFYTADDEVVIEETGEVSSVISI